MDIKKLDGTVNPANIEKIKKVIIYKMMFALGCEPREATPYTWLQACLRVVRDLSTENWLHSKRHHRTIKGRQVYYLSMEFLMGRTFTNALIAEGLYDIMKIAIKEMGQDFDEIINQENDPALGNGGLGRLAACFLDSMTTMGIMGMGYGIRYEYGMFKQEIRNGEQIEKPDEWLIKEVAWPYVRPNKRYDIAFGGFVRQEGKKREWHPDYKISALAYDHLVPAYGVNMTNTLRLWKAQTSGQSFDLADFNRGEYFDAMEERNASENVSRILYPDDSTYIGRELRLRQEYFLCSASLQDILHRHLDVHDSLSNLAEKVTIHLNDTHPTLAIPELMRLLIDVYQYSWSQAWNMVRRIFSYTNHTLMGEALETWSVDMLGTILPRHLEIIFEINDWFLGEVRTQFPNDEELVRRVSIIDEYGGRKVRMAWLAVIGSHKVNGVAKLHSDLMVKSIFADFAKIYPNRFTNVTNGVTPRRWIGVANTSLANLLDKHIGEDWRIDLTELAKLNALADDVAFQEEISLVKFENKRRLTAYIEKNLGIKVNPDAIFDVQIKRIHEYKRQFLNILHIITFYNRILKNPDANWQPRVFIFAGKSASAYYAAKKIIHLINDVAKVINNDERIRDLIKVVFIPNYGVSLAQIIIPAADISEQISLAGTEASGTSNMKFALNGALTIGTLDGANVEILNAVGADNIFIFGNTVEQVEQLRHEGYSPITFLERDKELQEVVKQISLGVFSPDDPARYHSIINPMSDYYQAFADYRSYVDTQDKISAYYQQPQAWVRSAILNIANMGYFSSDRAIMDYAQKIWNIEPLYNSKPDTDSFIETMLNRFSNLS